MNYVKKYPITMRISEDIYLIKQPMESIFTGVTVVIGEKIGLVDTGLESTPEEYIFPFLRSLGRKEKEISIVVNTHCDGDHIEGNESVKRVSGAQIAAHRLDRNFWGSLAPALDMDIELEGGDNIRLGDRIFRVVHTPGHTSGSICLYDKDDGVLLSGDSIQGHGVPDDERGPLVRTSRAEYVASMKKLMKLNVKILVMDHPYKPFKKALLVDDEVEKMLSVSISAVTDEHVKWLRKQYGLDKV